MPASRFSLLSLAVLSSLSLSGAAHAADDDTIVTDRPGVAESSKVVGKGRVQLETSVAWERQRDDELHSRTLTTPSLLRVGLGDTLELRIETDGRTIEHDVDPASGAHAVSAGWADTELGLKWHVADQQGSHPSLGWLLH
ncbi:MAG: transporter, partial [Oxalobacteraceae bacterium]